MTVINGGIQINDEYDGTEIAVIILCHFKQSSSKRRKCRWVVLKRRSHGRINKCINVEICQVAVNAFIKDMAY